jgi:allophanate hydrolase subunit 2
VAVVATADHGLLGQCGPGTEVRFRPIDTAEAVDAWRAGRRRLEHSVVGHYPLAVD